MKKILQWGMATFLILGTGLSSHGQMTVFDYTGGMQTYLVPVGVTSLHMELFGGEGYGNLGYGGRVEAILTVTPGETLNIFVGGAGGATTGGYNGGGTPGATTSYGGGGGASDVRQGGVALTDRIIVAGGGGGSGSNCGLWTAEGGHGGGLIAQSGCLYSCSDCQYTGAGGSQVAGGIAGPTAHGSCGGNTNGSLGIGGSNLGSPGTGGGGGYYGGGSGCYEGAGGGSSYTDPSAIDVVHEQGVQVGNGQIIITVLCSPLTVTVSESEVCFGEEVTLDALSDLGGTISWDGGVTNGEAFTPPAGTTTYTATSDSDGDCAYSVDINVLETPDVVGTSTYPAICLGESFIFLADGADTYVWDPADIVTGDEYTPAAAGTFSYTLTGTDALTGCSSTYFGEAVVNALPEVDATASDLFVCIGEEVTFSGAGAVSYSWDMGVVDGDPVLMETVGITTYTVTGTDENGCVNTASVEVEVAEEIDITYVTTDELFGSDGSIDATISGGYTPYSFDWDNDVTGDFDDTEDLSGLSGGDYILVVQDAQGCTSTVTVNVNSLLGLNESTNLKIDIHPNPTTDQITISSEGNFAYQLVAINGEVIANGTGFNQTNVSLAELADGVYFITLSANNATNTVKVIKQ